MSNSLPQRERHDFALSATSCNQGPSLAENAPDVETSSDDYARRFAGPAGAWMLARQTSVILGWLPRTLGATVLDVGGGHAQAALPLMKAGYRVTVQGSSDICQRRITRELREGKIGFVVSSIYAIPFSDQTFDHVICLRLLPHCEAWRSLIHELCRLARHDVVIDYPNRSSFNVMSQRLFWAKKWIEKNTRPFTLFTHQQIADAFMAEGFYVKAKVNQFFFPMAMHRAIRWPGLSNALERAGSLLDLTRRWGSPTLLWAARSRERE